MEEEINAGPEINITEKINTKFGFLNWLGIAWAFYWRILLLSFLLGAIMITVKYYLVNAFKSGGFLTPNLIFYFMLSAIPIILIACYMGTILAVRWVMTLRSRVFAIRLIGKNNNDEIQLNDVKFGDWLKIGWAFLWKEVLLTLAGVMLLFLIYLIIKYSFGYLFKSFIFTNTSNSYQTFFQYIKYFRSIVTVFVGIVFTGICVKWVTKSRFKRFKLTVIRNSSYTGNYSRYWIIALVIFIFSYVTAQQYLPWKNILVNKLKTTASKNISREEKLAKADEVMIFFKTLTNDVEEIENLMPKWKKLQIKNGLEGNKNKNIQNQVLAVIKNAQIIVDNVDDLQVPRGLKNMKKIKKLKKEYCDVMNKVIHLSRRINSCPDPVSFIQKHEKEISQVAVYKKKKVNELIGFVGKSFRYYLLSMQKK